MTRADEQRFYENIRRRWSEPHPYSESGKWYGCECGKQREDAIHTGMARPEVNEAAKARFHAGHSTITRS